MSQQNKPETKTCGRCGKTFDCFARTGGCWCEKLPPLSKAVAGHDCLCPQCLEKEIQAQQAARKP